MRIFKTFVTLLILAAATLGQTGEFAKIVNRYKTEKNFNGVVLIATDGKVDFVTAVGVADRQNDVPVTAKTRFKIMSITKTFTAVLILRLYEQGKIDLNAPFGKYFPEYKGEAKNSATIHHLLTYASGIPNEADKLEMGSYKIPLTPDAYIDKYCSGKPEFASGEKSVYSNSEYIILGRIIEKLTGKSFEANVRDEILTPLGLADTGLASAQSIIKNFASSYVYDEKSKTFQNDEPYHIENFSSSAAMYSTIGDLAKFDAAIFGGRLLKPSTLELMLTTNPKLGDVAYGFWGSDGFGNFDEKFYYRPGGILGANANWIHTMKTKKSIIVFSNTSATNLFELSGELYVAAKKAPAKKASK